MRDAYNDVFDLAYGRVYMDAGVAAPVVCAPRHQQATGGSAALLSGTRRHTCIYRSVQSYTAECPEGMSGEPVTRTATAESSVSQEEADSLALEAAVELATEALECI